jgi:DNA adenine methylase
MRYLGAKNRIAKEIVEVMSAEREEGMTWVEPFMGSGKVISLVNGRRIGADVNHEMIALFKAIRGGWKPPADVSREFYYEVKNNQENYSEHFKAFINIGCSFGGKRWGGFATDNASRNYAQQAHNTLMRLKPLIQDIGLHSCDYKDLAIPKQSFIYCDPPYRNTTGYGFKFNHDEVDDWCRDRVKEGHYVFVSEYSMPDDFELAWSKEVKVTLDFKDNNMTKTEKLFRLHKKPPFKLTLY